MIHHGDCLDVLRRMPNNSVDSIVTDPPYGLAFMGKKWDYDVPSVEIWAECLRVLKPGGHLLAFAGTRTQHRMAVRIEDAGFEIRDMICWTYASGFPKSHNLDNLRGEKICGCAVPYAHDRTEQTTQHDLRPVRVGDVPQAKPTGEECRQVLQSGVQEQGAPTTGRAQLSAAEDGRGQSSLEGWGDTPQAARELRSGALYASADVGCTDGESGRLRDGAPPRDGEVVRLPADANGVRASRGSQPAEQFAGESGALAGQPEPQTLGAWPVCRGCGLPVLPRGLGTALKPALEPITVARKPLAGTVAANVLAHGTGAINVDACRVEGEPVRIENYASSGAQGCMSHGHAGGGGHAGRERIARVDTSGRWPANLIHDGSEEVADVFGDPARFFYCAKASKRDREDGNNHPTVKPTDLMRYLCRLVTPPGGTVLDPFMGSGSTGKAAVLEGFRFIGCEMEKEYVDIARKRILSALVEVLK